MDAVDEALAAAKAEQARLSTELASLQQREAAALAEARTRHVELRELKAELERGIDEITARLIPLEQGRNVALSRARKWRKVKNVLLRLGLGTVAFSGLMLAITTDWGFWPIFGIAGLEGVCLWTLGDIADKLEMRDG